MKCIIDSNDLEDISCATIDGWFGVFFRAQERDENVMIYRKDEHLTYACMISGDMPLFVQPVTPYTDIMTHFLVLNQNSVRVVSTDKNFLMELFISYPTMELGLIEEPGTYLELEDGDYFVSFVILQRADDCRQRIQQLRDKHSNIQIYINDVRMESHVRQCVSWEADGMIIPQSRAGMVQKMLETLRVS